MTFRVQDSNAEHRTLNLESTLVKVDSSYFRPIEVELHLGDPIKSKTQLSWNSEYDLAGLVVDIIISDIKLTQKDKHLYDGGHEVYRQAE